MYLLQLAVVDEAGYFCGHVIIIKYSGELLFRNIEAVHELEEGIGAALEDLHYAVGEELEYGFFG